MVHGTWYMVHVRAYLVDTPVYEFPGTKRTRTSGMATEVSPVQGGNPQPPDSYTLDNA